MGKLTPDKLNLAGKRVFIRADLNVPLDENQNITDDTRIRLSAPTIEYAVKQGAKVIVSSHLGRPKGKRDPKQSLKPVAERLGAVLQHPVQFVPECIGPEVEARVAALKPGEVLVLENLRFHSEEEKGDEEFARKLAALCDVWVLDAFGTAHRPHASTAVMARFVKEIAAGFLMADEVKYLKSVVENPERPFVALLGGKKVSTKIDVFKAMLPKVDKMLIGGAMTYAFMKAQGQSIGRSFFETGTDTTAREILAQGQGKIVLPLDYLVVNDFENPTEQKFVSVADGIPEGWEGVDVGPQTIALFSEELKKAKTIVWNGPVGVFEKDAFAQGTKQLAELLRDLARSGVTVVLGGGDTVAAVNKFGIEGYTHVSSGGGASLEMLEGRELPGVAVLPEE
ncbi:MAG: hypothetical protein Kow0059_14040 [Candidatus Sumerlaeia bacterium]